jgi:hypothetical protein
LAGKSTTNVTSFEILKNDDYSIELLEEVHFQNKSQLHERECYFINKYADIVVNKCKPNAYNKVGKKIYGKKYHENNKEVILKQQSHTVKKTEKLYTITKTNFAYVVVVAHI